MSSTPAKSTFQTATKRKPFKSLAFGSRLNDFPTLEEATKLASDAGTIFYERGFYGVVWFEDSTRRVRILTGWSDNTDQVLKVDYSYLPGRTALRIAS